jgi:hypothetical protein
MTIEATSQENNYLQEGHLCPDCESTLKLLSREVYTIAEPPQAELCWICSNDGCDFEDVEKQTAKYDPEPDENPWPESKYKKD